MITKPTHRFSFLILPIQYIIDAVVLFFLIKKTMYPFNLWYFVFLLFTWFFISYFTKFYDTARNIRPAILISKTLKQLVIFNLSVFSFFNLLDYEIPDKKLIKYLIIFNLAIFILKIIIYILLKIYRAKGKNLRDFIVIGYNDETVKFKELLELRKDYGYRFRHFISSKTGQEIYGDLSKLREYLQKFSVDVVFVSLRDYSDEEIKEIISISDEFFAKVKFIPDNKQILGSKLNIEHYDYFPVLSLQKSPLDKPVNKIFKRFFDIIFSLIVLVGIMSWLYPILAILIKLESKGPVFFKQKRNGVNYHLFECYKFRSMYQNNEANTRQVSKNDNRITRIGKFLRKTSVDEMPQFINVLKGDMSVVGPRPHMVKENERFMRRVDKFMSRHYVKPGITGLAQVKGYRGEVKTDEDIINRIKYDLYYIENWSFWLDLKIIVFTVLKIAKGDEKAY